MIWCFKFLKLSKDGEGRHHLGGLPSHSSVQPCGRCIEIVGVLYEPTPTTETIHHHAIVRTWWARSSHNSVGAKPSTVSDVTRTENIFTVCSMQAFILYCITIRTFNAIRCRISNAQINSSRDLSLPWAIFFSVSQRCRRCGRRPKTTFPTMAWPSSIPVVLPTQHFARMHGPLVKRMLQGSKCNCPQTNLKIWWKRSLANGLGGETSHPPAMCSLVGFGALII